MNYRTVIGFGPKNIKYLLSKYDKLLELPKAKAVKDAHIAGFCFGYTNGIRYILKVLSSISQLSSSSSIMRSQRMYTLVCT
jgi:hypothetical protein